MKIIKRNGEKVEFDKQRIINAINAAFIEVDGQLYETDTAEDIAEVISKTIKENATVEDIQNLVEEYLMRSERLDVARAYVRYRYKKELLRQSNTTDKSIKELLDGNNDYWNKENSNKNAKVVTTQRDYLAGITSTDIAKRFLLPKEVLEAHEAGIIHEHDMDYLAQKALTNCCLINLEDMLENGTVINGVSIDPQHRITTATTVATQIITAVASSQYGGTTITLTHLAPYVRKSFFEHYKFAIEELFEKQDLSNNFYPDMPITSSEYRSYNSQAYEYARKRTNIDIKDAVQTFNYQINSMSTTNGQAPFLSVCLWATENPKYEFETALLIEEFLKQRTKGMKNEVGVYVTQAFPKLLYILDEDNVYENSKYYYLTELAAKCTAKQLTPDYISAKKMREYKVSPANGSADTYPCMGCRSFLTPDRCSENWAKAKNYQKGKSKYYGRFNAGVTTINLVDAALSSQKDFDEFWRLMEERTELCHKGLLVRLNRLEEVTSDVAPILWQHGAFARLDKGEKLHELLHHGYATVSLGYAGLYECVKYMTNESLSSKIGKEFGLKVMQFLNDKCNKWKQEEDIDYSVYGTPIESTTYKFAKCLKKRFGDDVFVQIDGKDRSYLTNSYHIPVFEKIDAFSKLKIESEFQKLSPGG